MDFIESTHLRMSEKATEAVANRNNDAYFNEVNDPELTGLVQSASELSDDELLKRAYELLTIRMYTILTSAGIRSYRQHNEAFQEDRQDELSRISTVCMCRSIHEMGSPSDLIGEELSSHPAVLSNLEYALIYHTCAKCLMYQSDEDRAEECRAMVNAMQLQFQKSERRATGEVARWFGLTIGWMYDNNEVFRNWIDEAGIEEIPIDESSIQYDERI